MHPRSHYCGHLRASEQGQEVCLYGWVNRRRDLGGLIFLDLRDREGLIQVVVEPDSAAFSVAEQLRSEFVVCVRGTVRLRPEHQRNPTPTGDIEVLAGDITLLSEAQTPDRKSVV